MQNQMCPKHNITVALASSSSPSSENGIKILIEKQITNKALFNQDVTVTRVYD